LTASQISGDAGQVADVPGSENFLSLLIDRIVTAGPDGRNQLMTLLQTISKGQPPVQNPDRKGSESLNGGDAGQSSLAKDLAAALLDSLEPQTATSVLGTGKGREPAALSLLSLGGANLAAAGEMPLQTSGSAPSAVVPSDTHDQPDRKGGLEGKEGATVPGPGSSVRRTGRPVLTTPDSELLSAFLSKLGGSDKSILSDRVSERPATGVPNPDSELLSAFLSKLSGSEISSPLTLNPDISVSASEPITGKLGQVSDSRLSKVLSDTKNQRQAKEGLDKPPIMDALLTDAIMTAIQSSLMSQGSRTETPLATPAGGSDEVAARDGISQQEPAHEPPIGNIHLASILLERNRKSSEGRQAAEGKGPGKENDVPVAGEDGYKQVVKTGLQRLDHPNPVSQKPVTDMSLYQGEMEGSDALKAAASTVEMKVRNIPEIEEKSQERARGKEITAPSKTDQYQFLSQDEVANGGRSRDREGGKVVEKGAFASVMTDKIQKIVEQYTTRGNSMDMVVRLKIDDKDTLLVGLKDKGQTVTVQVKTGSEGLINLLQSNKEAITRQLEEKNIYASIWIDPDRQKGFDERQKKEDRQGTPGRRSSQDENFRSLLDGVA
jgi:hypothetical protein